MEQNFISDPDILRLAKEIYEGRCIIFIGAGVSLNAGLPNWTGLEKLMKNEINLKGDYGPLRTADICKEYLGEQNFYNFIENHIKTNSAPTRLHRLLAKLPSDIFITTNYDTLMEDAIREERNNESLQIIKNDNPHKWDTVHSDNKTTWVLKMHGCIQNFPKNIVIGEQDYLSFADKNKHVVDCLSNLFSRKAVLFIGYSLSDWNITQLLHNTIIKTEGYSTHKYFIGINSDRFLKDYFESKFGLKVINVESSNAEVEDNVIGLLNQVSEKFEVPAWLMKFLKQFGCNIKEKSIDLKTPIKSLFPGFDSTIFIRLALRIEKEYDLNIPLPRLIEPNITIGEFIDLIKENNQKTLPNILYK